MNSDSQKPYNLEESKEKKSDIGEETETIVDEVKNSNESDSNVIGVSQNSNTYTSKYGLLNSSVLFDTIITLYVTYCTVHM